MKRARSHPDLFDAHGIVDMQFGDRVQPLGGKVGARADPNHLLAKEDCEMRSQGEAQLRFADRGAAVDLEEFSRVESAAEKLVQTGLNKLLGDGMMMICLLDELLHAWK